MVENSQNPLVSIILPTYNRAHTLLRAVNSVLNQEYREIELIVVDDASTDGSAALLDTLTDARLRIIRHKNNKGVAAATNTGLHAARGALIAFQDSDDEWLDGKLSQQMAQFAAVPPDCACVYCIKIVYGRDPQFRRGKRRVACVPGPEETLVEGDLRTLLWQRNIVSPQTALCTREAVMDLGGFDEKLRSDQDWDFFSRLAENASFAFIDAPLVSTYLQTDSISANSRKTLYSQFVVTNKMKRRGVPRVVLAEHWARIGYHIGQRRGAARRGATLLRTALAARPLHAKTWARYLVTRFLR